MLQLLLQAAADDGHFLEEKKRVTRSFVKKWTKKFQRRERNFHEFCENFMEIVRHFNAQGVGKNILKNE